MTVFVMTKQNYSNVCEWAWLPSSGNVSSVGGTHILVNHLFVLLLIHHLLLPVSSVSQSFTFNPEAKITNKHLGCTSEESLPVVFLHQTSRLLLGTSCLNGCEGSLYWVGIWHPPLRPESNHHHRLPAVYYGLSGVFLRVCFSGGTRCKKCCWESRFTGKQLD